MRTLLITPPMVQINAPYPATAYLAGVLREQGCAASQADASLMLALRLFSAAGVRKIGKALRPKARGMSVRHFRTHVRDYAETVDGVIRFLQGRDPSLAHRIVTRRYLPEGPRFDVLDESVDHHAPLSTHDLGVHLASLYLDDISDAIRDGVDSRFELARYGEKLAASAASFDGIAAALRRKPTLIDGMIDELAEELVLSHRPELVGLTVPFPGNVYGAFRMARRIKRLSPDTTVVMGGGYVSTELRDLSDPQVFDAVDFMVPDQGESTLLGLIRHLEDRKLPLLQLINADGVQAPDLLVHTFYRREGRVVQPVPGRPHPGGNGGGATPDFTGLPLADYVSMVEMPNPMHRIWSCGRWNKLVLAHGCYWHRCGFCDTSLDYIGRYLPTPVDVLVRQIEDVIRQTGQTGFHFVDEAMPPALLRRLAEALIERRIQITWWGNIRFDKGFTPELAELLARSGCVAVTGGLEAATDRLLTLMDKGFTLGQAARVMRAFAEAGVLVHAYLMYGFPSQTAQDTVDALEFVRQLFEAGYLHSAHWHRFALTVHSPIYRTPERYGIRLLPMPEATFARNEALFEDSVICGHEALGRGLRKALYNYMHGVGLGFELQSWFHDPVPPPTMPTDFVAGETGVMECKEENNA
jgi:radical SAM superfamily enzyme YgiQ (UPF0313 family)